MKAGSPRPEQIEKASPRQLLLAGYFVGLFLIAVPILDMAAALWPARPGDLQWRFGFLGLLGNSLLLPILGIFIATSIAYFMGHRRLLFSVTVVATCLAVGIAVASVMFALDTLQLLSNVRPEMKAGFKAASLKSGMIYGFGTVTLLWLAYGAWRSAQAIKTERFPKQTRTNAQAGTLVGR